MGNWRTVEIHGRVAQGDVARLKEELTYPEYGEKRDPDRRYRYWCIGWSRQPSVFGLYDWVREDGTLEGYGNLSERDYTLSDVKRELAELAEMFPTLDLKLHAGGENESDTCMATFVVRKGKVKRVKPQMKKVRAVSSDTEVYGRMMMAMRRK